jgi:hypothetical protein
LPRNVVYVIFKLKVLHFIQLSAAAKKMEFNRIRAGQIDNIANTSLDFLIDCSPPPLPKLRRGFYRPYTAG